MDWLSTIFAGGVPGMPITAEGGVPALGASLEGLYGGAGGPVGHPTGAAVDPTGASAMASGAKPSGGIADALRGVQVPKAPEVQKVATPNLPPLRPIQGGGMFDLLMALGLGPQQMTSGMKLPPTLGAALGRG